MFGEWGWAALVESIAAGSCLGIGRVEAAGDNCGALTRGRCGREGTHGACLGRGREACLWLGCTWCCQWNCVAPTSRPKSACSESILAGGVLCVSLAAGSVCLCASARVVV